MNNTYTTLYSRDSKGKILQWKIQVQNNGTTVDIMTSYGELEGKQTLKWKRNIQGKNIGKANETTPFEQACSEVESTIRRKKDKGYMSIYDLNVERPILKEEHISSQERKNLLELHLPLQKTDASGATKPMKCQQYYRSKKNWTDPSGEVWSDRKYYYLANPHVKKEEGAIVTKFFTYCQPKINGVRATIQLINNQVKILSKEGKEYNIPHILDYFNMNIDLLQNDEIDIVLDGELYIHGELLQDIASAVKKVSLMTQRVIFILFDLAIPDVNQRDRWNMVKSYKPIFEKTLNCPIELIKTYKVNNDEEAQRATDLFISKGYEGAIFRNFNNKYSFGGRPMSITKLKRAIDDEFKIINIVSQDVDPSLGLYECITKEGLLFKVTPKGNEQFKRNLLLNKNEHIGKNLTVTFYEWTKDKKPYHVLNNVIRDYE